MKSPTSLLEWWRSLRWQDRVFAVGGLIFTGMLMPTILSPFAVVPLWSSIPLAVGLAVYALTFWSMSMRWSAITIAIETLGWVTIAIWRHP